MDRAFCRNGGRAALVALCRTKQGVYAGASAIVVQNISDPDTIEALACREGLALAEYLSLTRLVNASDCQVGVNDIEQSSIGVYGAIIRVKRK